MQKFNKTEITGISVTLIVVVVGFAALKYFSLETISPDSLVNSQRSESGQIEIPTDTGTNRNEIAQALLNAVSSRGEVNELAVQNVNVGEGEAVKKGDRVTVHYIGMLRSGVVFDSSHDDNEPLTFTVGEGAVIRGLDQGIVGMQPGGERILIIPAKMGYADRAVGTIPPNSTLLFAIELLEKE